MDSVPTRRHMEGWDEREEEGRKKKKPTGLSHDSLLSQTHGEKKQRGGLGRGEGRQGEGALMLADALQRGREEEEKQGQEERRES